MFHHHHPSSSSCLDPSTNKTSSSGLFGKFLAYYSYSYHPTSTTATTTSSSPRNIHHQLQPYNFYDVPASQAFATGGLLEASVQHCSNSEGASGRVGRYSAEERKERIERYRSKRNHRNFHKKITYECRKTLADSRPRVGGRFVRKGEMAETNQAAANAEITYYDGSDCWQQIKVVEDGDGGGFYNNEDDDLLASFFDGGLLNEPSSLLARAREMQQ